MVPISFFDKTRLIKVFLVYQLKIISFISGIHNFLHEPFQYPKKTLRIDIVHNYF